jgi:serine/threonine protein kinase
MHFGEWHDVLVSRLGLLTESEWSALVVRAGGVARLEVNPDPLLLLMERVERVVPPGTKPCVPWLSSFQRKAIESPLDGGRSLFLDGGRILLIDELGSGGAGTVFLALDRLNGAVEVVAVKRFAAKPGLPTERIDREIAWTCSPDRWNYPHANHVVRARRTFVEGADRFLVMELQFGVSLDRYVRQLAETGQVVSVRQAIGLMLSALKGLRHLHSRGITHRDVKPANLIHDPDDRSHDAHFVCVVDLGIAVEPDAPGPRPTLPGAVVGTLDYMPPECFGNAYEAGPPADMYGLSATLYFLLVGDPPTFPLNAAWRSGGWRSVDAMRPWFSGSVPRPYRPVETFRLDVPPDLTRLIGRGLSTNPNERPTEDEFLCELERIGATIGPEPDPVPVALRFDDAAQELPSICELFANNRQNFLRALSRVYQSVDDTRFRWDQKIAAMNRDLASPMRWLVQVKLSETTESGRNWNSRLKAVRDQLVKLQDHPLEDQIRGMAKDDDIRHAVLSHCKRYEDVAVELLRLQHLLASIPLTG